MKCLFLCICFYSAVVDAQINKIEKSTIATIIETKVLCKEPNRYIGWPTITRTGKNELLVVFSGNRDAHICPFGITQMIRSQDSGMTWSTPETINNTPLDDRDAGIVETNRGTLLVSWFTSLAFDTPEQYKEHPEWIRHSEKLSDEIKQQWLGNWTRRSTDGGKSWNKPVKQIVSAPHGPIKLHDNSLLYVGIGMLNGKKVIGVEKSKNDGRTWKFISTIEIPAEKLIDNFWEPGVVEAADNKLIALIRYNSGDKSSGYLHQSESYDGGKSWTMLYKTAIWGFPAHLLKLSNGWILAVYGVRKPPFGERACISKDGGKSWDIENEITLSPSASGDLGYPASVQLEDGSILTVYYQIDQPGEKTCLMATHWRLNL
jgi:sialidase-1